MAVNYSDLTPGTAVVWKNTGGDKAMNMKALANAGIREGGKSASLIDGTKGMPEVLRVVFETKVQSAPTDGREFNLYFGWSGSATAGTDNPGGLTGADAPVADTDQLSLLKFVGAIVMASSLGTGLHRQDAFEVQPKAEYFTPVAHNDTGQTTSNVDGETVITVTPWYRRTPVA